MTGIRRYPNKPLGPQLREFDATFSMFAIIREHFAAQGTGASGHDPQGREAKPAGPVPKGDAPC